MEVRVLVLGLALLLISASIHLWSWPVEEAPPEAVPGTPSEPETWPETAGEKRAEVEVEEHRYLVMEAILFENNLTEEVEDTVYVLLPRNDTYQESFLLNSTIDVDRILVDEEGNSIGVFKVRLKPGETAWLNLTYRVIMKSYRVRLDYELARWPDLDHVAEYTSPTTFWNTENETIRSIADRVAGALDNPAAIAEELAAWAASHVQYVPMERVGSDSAIRISGGREVIFGDCEEVADVYITMARYLGVPARSAYGFLLVDLPVIYWYRRGESLEETASHWGGHTWPQVYVPPWGWIDVEMLEGFVPKVGDYSWRHILFGVESKWVSGASMADRYIGSWYLTDLYIELRIYPAQD